MRPYSAPTAAKVYSLTFGNFAGGFAWCGPAVVVWHPLACTFTGFRDRLIATAGAVLRVPSAIPRLGKTEFSGSCGTAEYLGVVRRIYTVQAARLHKSAVVFIVVATGLRPSRRSRAEGAQADNYRKRDEMLLSTHSNLPSVSLMTSSELNMGRLLESKRGMMADGIEVAG
jgi:hypothetical protein